MQKLTRDQRKMIADFFANCAVAWLSAGVITPFFLNKKFFDFMIFSLWGLIFSTAFLLIGINSVNKTK